MIWPLLVVALVVVGLWYFISGSVASNLCGLAGSVLVAVPFFRHYELRQFQTYLEKMKPGGGGAEAALQDLNDFLNKRRERQHISDFHFMRYGVSLLVMSYVVNIIPIIIAYFLK